MCTIEGAVRSMMGAAYRVPFCYVDDLAEEVKQMKKTGICTYAAHLEENSYDEEDYRKANCILIGNEGNVSVMGWQNRHRCISVFDEGTGRVSRCGSATQFLTLNSKTETIR